ncbi:hypothetical protein F3Y22_tig00110782pilonHSYRG00026 [Hibiscus syriacus]|uniref:Integrase catalytic domain-containing protein n=1 Tax=Hibiscus syriacus TaxID=106335 RepID=A0A6A2ZTB5_HIBSY|nr:hypothetical protein F3Y22_tig00110782pilonHSYRG00026 [Hibiscus syriacus]
MWSKTDQFSLLKGRIRVGVLHLKFLNFCKEYGIKRHCTVRKTPQQNGIAERMNRSLNERARCLRLNAGFPNTFGLRLLTWRVILSIDRQGHHWLEKQKKDTTMVDFEQFPVKKIETSQPTSGGSAMVDLQDYNLARDRVRRMNIKPPNRLGFEDLVSFALTVSSDDPVTFHDVVTSQENDKWMATMVEEMESLNHNRTWELVHLPEGAAKKILGMEICRDRDSRKLWLYQRGYVEKMLEMFAMNSAKPLKQLVKFVSTCLNLVSNIGKQLSGSLGYVDSDYASELDIRRSTTWYVFTLGGGPICWKSIVQSVMALSTTEVEYMAAAEATKEALWLTGLVKELGVQQGGIQLLCNN